MLKVKMSMFAACVPDCKTCTYTTDSTKSETTCSVCDDKFALTTSMLCEGRSPSSHTLCLTFSRCLKAHMTAYVDSIGAQKLPRAPQIFTSEMAQIVIFSSSLCCSHV